MLATARAPGLASSPAPVRRVRLGTRAFAWLLPGVALALVGARGVGPWLVLGYDLLLALLFAWDAARLRKAQLEVRRELEPRLRARLPTELRWELTNHGTLALRVDLRDSPDPSLRLSPAVHAFALAPGATHAPSAELTPLWRGRARFGDLALRLHSRWGLASLVLSIPASTEVKVMPANSGEATRQQQLQRRALGNLAQRLRRAPQGSDLESLREYVASDSLRTIDWKASARRRRPITRLYQPERSQTLWVVLDASRTMATALGGDAASGLPPKTRFDVALESALALADGALRAGDRVGALVYADAKQLLLAPGRGRGHYRRLLDVLTEVQAEKVHLDVRGLVAELERTARKRSMVMLFTDLENEAHGAALCEHARMLTRRHLTFCVSLHDSLTLARAERAPQSDQDVFHRAAAIDLLEERTELKKRLEKRGVAVLEADERGLARAALDRYLEAKLHARL